MRRTGPAVCARIATHTFRMCVLLDMRYGLKLADTALTLQHMKTAWGPTHRYLWDSAPLGEMAPPPGPHPVPERDSRQITKRPQ